MGRRFDYWSKSKSFKMAVWHGAGFGLLIGVPQSRFLRDRDWGPSGCLWISGILLSYVVFGYLARRFANGTLVTVSIVSMLVLVLLGFIASLGVESTEVPSGEVDPLDMVVFVIVYLFLGCFFSLGNMLAGSYRGEGDAAPRAGTPRRVVPAKRRYHGTHFGFLR